MAALATTDAQQLEQKSEGLAVPIKKLKSSADDSCEFCGKVVKLVAPAKDAVPNPQYEQLLNCSFLPATDTASDTKLFDSFFKFCSVDKKNIVLISRPFCSTILKESGVPVVVRQVSFCFLLHESFLGPNALIVHFFSLGISNASHSAPMSFLLYGWLARTRIQFLWLGMKFIPFLNCLLVLGALFLNICIQDYSHPTCAFRFFLIGTLYLAYNPSPKGFASLAPGLFASNLGLLSTSCIIMLLFLSRYLVHYFLNFIKFPYVLSIHFLLLFFFNLQSAFQPKNNLPSKRNHKLWNQHLYQQLTRVRKMKTVKC